MVPSFASDCVFFANILTHHDDGKNEISGVG